MKHYSITVYGRVQGVFFRNETRNIARYLRIKGFVKNKTDGSVYIEAEGNTEKLTEFIKWCKKGPDSARVDEILVEERNLKNHNSFTIKY